MFDLIGYWFIVSLVVISLMYPLVVVGYFVSSAFLSRVLGLNSLTEASKIVDKYVEFGKVLRINGKDVTNDFGHFVLFLFSFCMIVTLLINSWNNSISLGLSAIGLANSFGTMLAPYASYLAVPMIAYYTLAYFAKKGMAVKDKIDRINAKLKESE